MVMTPLEICSDYRQAKNKQKQITILAELNYCHPREIAALLRESGEELPKFWRDKLAVPAKRYRQDGTPRAASPTEGAAEDGGTPRAASPTEEAEAAAERIVPARPEPKGGITVGKLRELLQDVPDETPVLLDSRTPLWHLRFVREFDAASGEIRDTLMLSPF